VRRARDVYTLPERHAETLAGALLEVWRARDIGEPAPRPVTVVRAGARVLTLRCPQCGGALDAPAARVVCPYCKTVCAVEASLQWRFAEREVPTAPLWLRFKGPSAARLALQKTLAPALARARQRARKEALRAQPPVARAPQGARRSPPPSAPAAGGNAVPLWVIPLVVAAVAAALMALGR